MAWHKGQHKEDVPEVEPEPEPTAPEEAAVEAVLPRKFGSENSQKIEAITSESRFSKFNSLIHEVS